MFSNSRDSLWAWNDSVLRHLRFCAWLKYPIDSVVTNSFGLDPYLGLIRNGLRNAGFAFASASSDTTAAFLVAQLDHSSWLLAAAVLVRDFLPSAISHDP